MRLTPFYPLFEEAPDDSTPAGGGSMLDNAGTGEGAEPTGVAERPDYVPEKFWDSDKGETRLEALTKSYGEFEKKFHESGKFIGAPEGGEYEISLPEGIEAELNTEDPVLQWFQGQAAEMGLSQD
ncbi:MAG: hypothetical protein KJP02_05190, partial [Octadecabacter sp.]|nr:hypothetical protein [Octadecabacter sp.]